MSPNEKRAMVKRDQPELSISQQCKLTRPSPSVFYYNTERPNPALDRQSPDDAYWAGLKEQKAA